MYIITLYIYIYVCHLCIYIVAYSCGYRTHTHSEDTSEDMTMTLPTLLLMTGALLSVTCLLPVAAHTMLNYRQYHSSQEIHQFLRNISRKYPTLTHLYDIGESQKGYTSMCYTNIFTYIFKVL